ncbi:MAG: ParB/RepB/Spo0J family partition protein [Candidatus Helarchaeota archaeon]
MKIKIGKIKLSQYNPRINFDEDYIRELADSLKTDGLWNPLLVRRMDDGNYELISGANRLRAAKLLGWDEIEVRILDVNSDIGALLAIKTNLLQKNLSDIEEAKAIKKIIDEFGYTQSEIAKMLGKSITWVSNRLALILDISKKVQNALKENKITTTHAVLISKLSKNEQDLFLDYILDYKLNVNECRESLKKFQNRILYTIGYQGKNLDEFIDILIKNKISILVDIRDSVKSINKPEFNSEILKRELNKNKIEYIHKPELGVIYQVRKAYIDGYLTYECFKKWYNWHLKEINFNIEDFKDFLKKNGRSCFMCMEQYPKPKNNQKYYCHRDFLVEVLLNHVSKNPLLNFSSRIDL